MTGARLSELYGNIRDFLSPELRTRWSHSACCASDHSSRNVFGTNAIISKSEAINRSCGDHIVIHSFSNRETQQTHLFYEGTFCTVCEISAICLCSFFPDWGSLPTPFLTTLKTMDASHTRSHSEASLALFSELFETAQAGVSAHHLDNEAVFMTGLKHILGCIRQMPGRAGCAILPWSATAAIEAEWCGTTTADDACTDRPLHRHTIALIQPVPGSLALEETTHE